MGKAFAGALAEAGAPVVIVARDAARHAAAAGELTSRGLAVSAIDADITADAGPEEIAPSVVFLASPASSFMTGAVLVIDGGYTLW